MSCQLTKLKNWIDRENGNFEDLKRFQKSTPLAEVSIVSACRRMIHKTDLHKIYRGCDSSVKKPLHVALFTDCLVLCSIRQNVDKPVSRAMCSLALRVTLLVGCQILAMMVPFMNVAGGEVSHNDEWSPPCDATIQFKQVPSVLKMWWRSYKRMSRSEKVQHCVH